MQIKNLRLIGTNHIAKQSLEDVKKTIESDMPDIIAVELDKKRLPAVLDRTKRKRSLSAIRTIGFKGFIFSIIGEWAERKLGEKTGVLPGEEMATAIRAAQEKRIGLALIDQDIEVTLRNFSRTISWKEKFRFLGDIFKGFFYALTGKQPKFSFDINKVPESELIEKMIEEVKGRYPNIYKALISDRDAYMAGKLEAIMRNHPDKKIIAFMGAGHMKGIKRILDDRFKDDNAYSFGYSVEM